MYGSVRKYGSTEVYGSVRKGTEEYGTCTELRPWGRHGVRKCTEPILRQFLEKCPHFRKVVRECMFCSKNAILLIWGAFGEFCSKNAILLIWGAFGDFCSKNAILLIWGAFGDLAARSCIFATCDGFVVVL